MAQLNSSNREDDLEEEFASLLGARMNLSDISSAALHHSSPDVQQDVAVKMQQNLQTHSSLSPLHSLQDDDGGDITASPATADQHIASKVSKRFSIIRTFFYAIFLFGTLVTALVFADLFYLFYYGENNIKINKSDLFLESDSYDASVTMEGSLSIDSIFHRGRLLNGTKCTPAFNVKARKDATRLATFHLQSDILIGNIWDRRPFAAESSTLSIGILNTNYSNAYDLISRYSNLESVDFTCSVVSEFLVFSLIPLSFTKNVNFHTPIDLSLSESSRENENHEILKKSLSDNIMSNKWSDYFNNNASKFYDMKFLVPGIKALDFDVDVHVPDMKFHVYSMQKKEENPSCLILTSKNVVIPFRNVDSYFSFVFNLTSDLIPSQSEASIYPPLQMAAELFLSKNASIHFDFVGRKNMIYEALGNKHALHFQRNVKSDYNSLFHEFDKDIEHTIKVNQELFNQGLKKHYTTGTSRGLSYLPQENSSTSSNNSATCATLHFDGWPISAGCFKEESVFFIFSASLSVGSYDSASLTFFAVYDNYNGVTIRSASEFVINWYESYIGGLNMTFSEHDRYLTQYFAIKNVADAKDFTNLAYKLNTNWNIGQSVVDGNVTLDVIIHPFTSDDDDSYDDYYINDDYFNTTLQTPSNLRNDRGGPLVTVSAVNKPHLVKSFTGKRRLEFKQARRASLDANHELVFAVNQLNLDKLEREVIDRATPGNPLYQQWLTFDEVGDMITNEPAFQKISEFLSSVPGASISKVTQRKEYIIASAPIASWESAFQAEFHEWHDLAKMDSNNSPRVYLRSETYTIPNHLDGHLDHIFNIVQQPPLLNNMKPHLAEPIRERNNLQGAPVLESCTPLSGFTLATPSFLNTLYGISSNIGSASYKQAVFETADESFSPTDLTQFQNTYLPGVPTQTCMAPFGFSTDQCSAPNNNYATDCYEGNLDVQYMMAIAQQTETIYYYVTSETSTDPFVLFATDLANSAHPPQVNSISWGENEYYVDSTTSSTFNTEAMKLGAIGVTVMVSSGDNGAPSLIALSSGASVCGCPGQVSGIDGYTASFPATSPWVTAVGATQGPTCSSSTNSSMSMGPEVVCSSQQNGLITSGGGFSDINTAPSWQTSAISSYLSTVPTKPLSGFSTTGRGYPDVAMLGVDYPVIVQGTTQVLYGTSASSPLFAAMITLVNSQRLASGQGPVGFINPSLYTASAGTLFTDVTSGDNNCCSAQSAAKAVCCTTGFTATTGWDPTTGFGSMTLSNLKTALSGISSTLLPDDRLGDDYLLTPTPKPTLYPTPTGNNDDINSTNSASGTFSTGATIGIVIAIIVIVLIVGLRFFRIWLYCNACAQCCGQQGSAAASNNAKTGTGANATNTAPWVSNPMGGPNIVIVQQPNPYGNYAAPPPGSRVDL